MSRTSEMSTRRFSSSLIGGTTLRSSPASVAWRLSSRTQSAEMLGMATIAVVARARSATSASRLVVPRTGTPRMRRWRLSGSSSSSATGRQRLWPSRSIEEMSCRPPSPAPITTTGVLPAPATVRVIGSCSRRYVARPHAITTSAMNVAATGTAGAIPRSATMFAGVMMAPTPAVTRPSSIISSSVPVVALPLCSRTVPPSNTCSPAAPAARMIAAAQPTSAIPSGLSTRKPATAPNQTNASNPARTKRLLGRSRSSEMLIRNPPASNACTTTP